MVHTISGLLKKRDELMGELLTVRERQGELHNDLET
jgi:hypothetical protein